MPDALGSEVALIGSAAAGWADHDSDVELLAIASQMPTREAVTSWAAELGAEDPVVEEGDQGPHLIGRFGGEWFEIQWRSLDDMDRLVDRLALGETTSRSDLIIAEALAASVVLRSDGIVADWQRRLAEYPPGLAKRIIEDAAAFWAAPHHLQTLWTLADRGDAYALTEWLHADIQDALRIVFALNEAWEPDWKWLRMRLARLERVPNSLADRIDAVFRTPDLDEAVSTSLDIIQDVLGLVGADVSRQLGNVRASRR